LNIRVIIAEVLKKRHSKVASLEKIRQGLAELEISLDNFQQMASQARTQTDEIQPEFIDLISGVVNDTSHLREEIVDINLMVSNLIKRFSKDTINIGVAGKARQGKSTILQKISGLSDTEIPTSNELPCTGAKSKIYHFEGRSYARVEFYTQEEFLKEILQAYFEKLNLPRPILLERFREALPDFNSEASRDRNLEKAIYEKLKDIHQAFPSFYHFLSKPAEVIELSQVSDYVTQSHGRTKYFAVKAANVYTKFPNHDVTGLCLVDLPGLEAAQGHEKKLIASLEQEVDAVILVKLPSAQGTQYDADDYKVIDLINDSIREINLADWLFIILNELSDGSNKPQVQLLKDNPPTTYNNSYPTILTANCHDIDKVEQEVFSPILAHIEQKLEGIDKRYIKALANKFARVANELSDVLKPICQSFATELPGLGMDLEFSKLFKRFMDDLKVGLEDLVLAIRQEIEPLGDEFKQKVLDVCAVAKENPPISQPSELERQYKVFGGWNRAVEEELNNLRAYLTEHLATHLDAYLQAKIDEKVTAFVSRIFPQTFREVLLQDNQEGNNSRIMLRVLLEQLNQDKQLTLYTSFAYILKFSFAYHSHFHYRVREEMRGLETYTKALVQEIVPNDATQDNVPEKAEEVAAGLLERYQQTIYYVSKRLSSEEMQTDPGKAIFSLVEEIKDRLIRTRDIDEQEWRPFLSQMRGKLWTEEFGRFEKEIALKRQWQQATEVILRNVEYIQTAFSI
jgi:hypothetical protein